MEITRKNFAEEFVNITKDLKRSCFVGFDAEFTAILSKECFKHRLFDTNEERYDKIKTEVSKMIMTQVGITMFTYDREHDAYLAKGYTFHLCPQEFGDVDQSFIYQASTLRFLCRHNFDFNKFTYEGLPYLSEAEEERIRQLLKENSLFSNLVRTLDMEDEKLLQNYCSEVSRWLTSSDEGTMYLEVEIPSLRFIVHNELRMRFPSILTTDSLGNSNKVLIYRDKHIEGANSAPKATLEENLINHLLGFSQIIRLLKTYGKPIVGHNIFLDLVLLHSQFKGPLPKKYSTFKKNIHEMLPIIFDTKYISHKMGTTLSFNESWKSNALQDLFEFFSEGKCKKLQNGVNLIQLSLPFDVKQSYHEAGWDSYCSGYCLIRLGHWIACENSGKYRPVGPTEKLAALAPYANKVNVIRGAVPYMNIVGVDPPRNRPELLHVKVLKDRVINVSQAYISLMDDCNIVMKLFEDPEVASLLASFGSIDIKPHGTRSALIAANSNHTVNRILKEFKNNREYRISTFNKYTHTSAGRVMLWGSAVITGSLVLFYLHKKVK